jgi:hypothetical protein
VGPPIATTCVALKFLLIGLAILYSRGGTERLALVGQEACHSQTISFDTLMQTMEERAPDKSVERVDARFDHIDLRFDQVDRQFRHVEAEFHRIDERFKQADGRFQNIETAIG